MKNISLPISLNKLIESLERKNDFSPAEITKLVNEAKITAEQIKPWADFDHPKTEGYGRKLVYQADHFEIMVMSWAPRDYTAIHNHGYTAWGAVQVFGSLEHISFKLNENFLHTLHKEKLSAGEILSVNQNLIHQMGNPTEGNILSIHIYGTAEKHENVTADSSLYEVGKHETQIVNGGVFLDLMNDQIKERTPGLKADRLTEIGHYASLLNLYLKSNRRGAQYNKAVKYFQNRSFEGRFSFELELDTKKILYFVELKKARKLLNLLRESTKTIDSIINEINDLEKYS